MFAERKLTLTLVAEAVPYSPEPQSEPLGFLPGVRVFGADRKSGYLLVNDKIPFSPERGRALDRAHLDISYFQTTPAALAAQLLKIVRG